MEKQKYRFSLTEVRPAHIRYNEGLLSDGSYYRTYDYNSTEELSAASTGYHLGMKLGPDFIGRIVRVATFRNGALISLDTNYLVTESSNAFSFSGNTSYIISWQTQAFEPNMCQMLQGTTYKVHPVFSRIALRRERAQGSMAWTTALNSDIKFKYGAFDYIAGRAGEGLIFTIERFDHNTQQYYLYYRSLPFTDADCVFDNDKREVTVDFRTFNYYSYLADRMNTKVNLCRAGYKHEELHYNAPGMMQVYVDGSDSITNIVGGSATEVKITCPETPDDFQANNTGPITQEKWWGENRRILYMQSLQFYLVGCIADLQIVGGNYTPSGSSVIMSPAGYYHITTSDNQVSQIYQPTRAIEVAESETGFYLKLNSNTRYLSLHRVDNDAEIYRSTQPVSVSSLLTPDSISGTILRSLVDVSDACAVRMHTMQNVYNRILTAVEPQSGYVMESRRLDEGDFAYDGPAYQYAAFKVANPTYENFVTLYNGSYVSQRLMRPRPYGESYVKLICSVCTERVDVGLGTKYENAYYSYANHTQSYIENHLVPIGQYLWTHVSFYAALPENYQSIMTQWSYYTSPYHFFTIGTAIREVLRHAAPGIRFLENTFCSSILYSTHLQPQLGNGGVKRPNIYFTHVSNMQVIRYNREAAKIEMSIGDILNLLHDAFQIYYYIDDDGYLHLEHISKFYYNTDSQLDLSSLSDAYTKQPVSYGQHTVTPDDSYLFSDINLTADSDDALELFRTLKVKCLDARCFNASPKEVNMGIFKTDIDYLLASASDRMDGIAMLLPSVDKLGQMQITQTRVYRCDIKGIDDWAYPLWPTNYEASSYKLLEYYRWNFPSEKVDHCDFTPIEVTPFKTYEFQIPLEIDLDMSRMISTDLGLGLILSYEVSLDSRWATIKVLLIV